MSIKLFFFFVCFGLALCCCSVRVAATDSKPHIVFILADDYGWANVGYHRTDEVGKREVQTPRIDGLVKQGIELNRHYTFKFCSPSRSAFQSGRNPIHVNVLNVEPSYINTNDPVSGFAGIPRNMTGIAEKMKQGGYKTHMIGKWDVGMATPDHTPQGRGYDTSLHYFHHCNDYWRSTVSQCGIKREPVQDLWVSNSSYSGPAYSLANNVKQCAPTSKHSINFGPDAPLDCVYEDELFGKEVIQRINEHDVNTSLFLFYAPHSVHMPLQIPYEYEQRFDFITDSWERKIYAAMVNYMDTIVGQIEDTLKSKNMWNNTLIVFSSDNGGPVYNFGSGFAGANNWPLRGGKMSNFEGGIRVNAFVSGGIIPQELQGTKNNDLICLWDWYSTFSALAGVDPTDSRAAAANLPPIDSINVWPGLMRQKMDTRPEIALGADASVLGERNTKTLVQGIIVDDRVASGSIYKLLTGMLIENFWQGPQYPNATSSYNPLFNVNVLSCNEGCLFDIENDPTEQVNLNSEGLRNSKNKIGEMYASIYLRLSNRIETYRESVFSPNRGAVDERACAKARERNGFWGPFLD